MCELNQEELRYYLHCQIEEINKFIWELGYILNQDPLNIFSREELARIWIDRHAMTFHNKWFNKD